MERPDDEWFSVKEPICSDNLKNFSYRLSFSMKAIDVSAEFQSGVTLQQAHILNDLKFPSSGAEFASFNEISRLIHRLLISGANVKFNPDWKSILSFKFGLRDLADSLLFYMHYSLNPEGEECYCWRRS